MLAVALAALLASDPAPGTMAFDLLCKDPKGGREVAHLSVNLRQGTWCLRKDGACNVLPIIRHSNADIVFRDQPNAYSAVNRVSGIAEGIVLPGIRCEKAPFTPLPEPIF